MLICSTYIFQVFAMCWVLFLEPSENMVDSALMRLMLKHLLVWTKAKRDALERNKTESLPEECRIYSGVLSTFTLSIAVGCRACRDVKRLFYRGARGPCPRSAIGRDKEGTQASPSCWDALLTEPTPFSAAKFNISKRPQRRGAVSHILRNPENSIYLIACIGTLCWSN